MTIARRQFLGDSGRHDAARVRGLVCGVLVCAVLFVLPATPAFALAYHSYEAQISEVPSSEPGGKATLVPGPLVDVNAMTIDEGSLFVAEKAGAAMRIDQFNAASRGFEAQLPRPAPYNPFVNPYGVAVGHAAGGRQLYLGYEGGGSPSAVAAYEETAVNVWRFDGLWSGPGGGEAFGSVRGVAVDDSHAIGDGDVEDVYVSDWENHVVDLFKPGANGSETLVGRITEAGHDVLSHPRAVAVDRVNGDVAIADATEPAHNVYVFTVYVLAPETMPGSYRLLETLTGPPGKSFGEVTSVAFDDSADEGAGDVFVGEGTPSQAGRVYEFTPAGQLRLTMNGATTPQGGFEEVKSFATDPATGQVWAGDRHTEGQAKTVHGFADRFGEVVTVPDPVTGIASVRFVEENGGEWGARLNGTVNPVNAGDVTLCRFVWGESPASTGETADCTAKVANGGSPVAVHANIGKLAPDTTYYYRLQAGNAHGVNEGEPVEDRQFTTPGPGLHSVSVSDVTASSALLEGVVEPHAAPVAGNEQDFQVAAKVAPSYFFQYSTSATGECGLVGVVCASAPASAASVGFGPGEASVTQPLAGLVANTVYHYRLVVEAETSEGVVHVFDGPDETFLTRPTGAEGVFGLLDGRAWEQVSPVDKHGGHIFGLVRGNGERAPIQASPDGRGAMYGASAPTETQPGGYVSAVPVLSRRGSAGWSSVDISAGRALPTEELVATPEFQLASSDLSSVLMVPFGGHSPQLSSAAGELTPYLRNQPVCEAQGTGPDSGCFTPLLDSANLPQGAKVGEAVNGTQITMEGATPDLQHVLLLSSVALTAAPIGGPELYEWSADTAQIQPVSVLPEAEGGLIDNVVPAGSGSDPSGKFSAARNAISTDGSRVFWSDAGESGRRLFMRDLAGEETIRLDVPEAGVGAGETPEAMFQLASARGDRVLFTDTQRLTANAGIDKEAHYGDLYECRIVREAGHDHCDLTDLTPESNGQAADVQKLVLGASENAEYAYFVADGAMAPGAVHGTCTANRNAAGELCNLYVEHEGALRLVAVLEGGDEGDWGTHAVAQRTLGYLTARVSGNGRFVAFMSRRSLTGYDNRDVHSGAPDQEVYLYDAQSRSLACVSCDPTGARPVGVNAEQLQRVGAANLAAIPGSTGTREMWIAGNLPGWEEVGTFGAALYEPRNLSDEGRLFFNSTDALVSGDVNGVGDVYEFEPLGVGSCAGSSPVYVRAEGGCVGLVSSGLSSGESGFLDASESGSDVFFLTAEKLVTSDTDAALDVYDARVCSEREPCVKPAVSSGECENAASCRETLGSQPEVFGAPASGAFEGSGNVAPAAASSVGVAPGKHVVKPLTRKQRLRRAVARCRVRYRRRARERRACVRSARRRFAVRRGHGKRGGRS